VDWYLNDNKHGIYPSQIQAEMVDTILWMLWSSDLTDTTVLRHAIEEEIKNKTGQAIQVGLRWRTIMLDKPGRIPDDEAVKALHIEVDRTFRNEAKRILEEIYSSKATQWPLHLRLRAVPLLKDVMNRDIKMGIRRLMGRQQSFNDEEFGKRKITSWEIKELDFVGATSNLTLRDMIMAIVPQDDPSRRLFHSVDNLRSNRSTVVFTCMPALESEARNVVAGLVTYLVHVHGQETAEFFTKDAQIRAADSFWDTENHCVRNKDDEHVEGLLSDDVDADYLLPPPSRHNATPSAGTTPPDRPTPISLQRNTYGEDGDSISTFRQHQARFSSTILSGDSDSTIRSMTTRLASLETLLLYHKINLPPEFPPPRVSHSEGLNTAGGSSGNRAPGEGS
jgi:hypothetical protein